MTLNDVVIAPARAWQHDDNWEFDPSPRIITSEHDTSYNYLKEKFTAYSSVFRSKKYIKEKSTLFSRGKGGFDIYEFQVVTKNIPFFQFMLELPDEKESERYFSDLFNGHMDEHLRECFEVKVDCEKFHCRDKTAYLNKIQNEKLYEIARESVESRHWLIDRKFDVIDLIKGECRYIDIHSSDSDIIIGGTGIGRDCC